MVTVRSIPAALVLVALLTQVPGMRGSPADVEAVGIPDDDPVEGVQQSKELRNTRESKPSQDKATEDEVEDVDLARTRRQMANMEDTPYAMTRPATMHFTNQRIPQQKLPFKTPVYTSYFHNSGRSTKEPQPKRFTKDWKLNKFTKDRQQNFVVDSGNPSANVDVPVTPENRFGSSLPNIADWFDDYYEDGMSPTGDDNNPPGPYLPPGIFESKNTPNGPGQNMFPDSYGPTSSHGKYPYKITNLDYPNFQVPLESDYAYIDDFQVTLVKPNRKQPNRMNDFGRFGPRFPYGPATSPTRNNKHEDPHLRNDEVPATAPEFIPGLPSRLPQQPTPGPKKLPLVNPHAAKFTDYWDYDFVPSDDIHNRDPVLLGQDKKTRFY